MTTRLGNIKDLFKLHRPDKIYNFYFFRQVIQEIILHSTRWQSLDTIIKDFVNRIQVFFCE